MKKRKVSFEKFLVPWSLVVVLKIQNLVLEKVSIFVLLFVLFIIHIFFAKKKLTDDAIYIFI